MAKFVGMREPGKNAGEDSFGVALDQYLDEDHIYYKNREVYGKEFDFCLLIPEIGIVVIEVKGWKETTVQSVVNDGATILIYTEEGVSPQTPWKQVRSYRFDLMKKIRTMIDKNPLVFNMVAYPFISGKFYRQKGMDTVSEEPFTFLSEDMASPAAFRTKLDKAISIVRDWGRPDVFIPTLMKRVRSLFESDIQQNEDSIADVDMDISNKPDDQKNEWLVSLYSSFAFIAAEDKESQQVIQTLLNQYAKGTRIYLVIEDASLLPSIIAEVDAILHAKGLFRKKDRLVTCYGEKPITAIVSTEVHSFSCFNFLATSVQSSEKLKGMSKSFVVIDGQGIEEPEIIQALKVLDKYSNFNLHQYRIEHADSRKNIQVRAGAGTGKTHVMISRIIYLCYVEGILPADMRNRFVMITFTVAAADNMKQRLKACFQNYYLLTKNPDFIELTGQVDKMQICTIHAFAKGIIKQLGSQYGYGQEFRITSSQYSRRIILENVLEDYINKKIAIDRDFMIKLDIPIYELRKRFLALIDQIHNKSVDVGSLEAEQFGYVENPITETDLILHELILSVIPETEKEYSNQLSEQNRVQLGNVMSIFGALVQKSTERLNEMRNQLPQYMFVDEFQDTDDVQIETLLAICKIVNYRLFVVGDIKQCIYRFRGAEEKAFDGLKKEEAPDEWARYDLNKNYRTDNELLKVFQKVFYSLNAHPKNLLVYDPIEDVLTSSINHNAELPLEAYYKCVKVNGRKNTLPVLFSALHDAVARVNGLIHRGEQLSLEERTIAILVRENWQVDEVRKEGKVNGFPKIMTHAGGDLYQSAPALDMCVLLNTMLNNAQPEHIANLLTSNFFGIRLDRMALYEMRSKSTWMKRNNGNSIKIKQVNYLTNILNQALYLATDGELTWQQDIMRKLRTDSILQVLRKLYQVLSPWSRYSDDKWSQQFYRMNVDLLFEKIIDAHSVDALTLHSLAEFIQRNIATKQQEDCRWPQQEAQDINIVCMTVHKAKGLEYGWVILPYTDFRIDELKKRDLEVTVSKNCIGYRMKYYDGSSVQNNYFNYEEELEERMREETRILYVAMTRAIRSFTWLDSGSNGHAVSWQSMLRGD